jgi:hypothetical protein
VVVSWVVLGTVLFRTVDCVVVVVVGAGFSTTVVHEFKSRATARSGIRMMSFFIVEVVPSTDSSAQVPRADVFRRKYFPKFSS